ncbi:MULTISPECIES: M12 family metallopeptidase [Chryseobacterium]|jgi:hypothetical protein|uniref:Peptidase M12A domain-containing protein n=1 Tax=Chryseobacterium geocarposphaerae TaxID=1416776 RepID=A0ABU1LBH7_9FLAO|nr:MULTISPECIES: M12 family metallopeptidase [Chryseobacterium]MDR6404057.1 hypothetical protein [Chryseobacterium geocarposphaerae]MDR6698424.1 hypothetical protein [Chryseobacterium ginsenosidimutans]
MKLPVLLIVVFFAFSCKEKEWDEEMTYRQDNKTSRPILMDVNYKEQKLTVWKNENGDYLLDEDIKLYKNEVQELGPHTGLEKSKIIDWDQTSQVNITLWPSTSIKFKVDPSFSGSEKQPIYQALNHWKTKTNINFTEVGSNEKIYFRKVSSGCQASLGYPGNNGINTVDISPTCDVQSVTHEIGHVMGMIHEHQRINRNTYISLKPETFDFLRNNYASIYTLLIANLQKEQSNLEDPFPFDMGSVMMYGSYPRNNIPLQNDLISRNLPLFKKKMGAW